MGDSDERMTRLFEAVRIGNLTAPNRMVLAAMGRQDSTAGTLAKPCPAYHPHRAQGGVEPNIGEASAVDAPARPMSDNDIVDGNDGFARFALGAQAIGCDAIPLHGTRRHPMDQFLWAEINRRDDAYNPLWPANFSLLPDALERGVDLVATGCSLLTNPNWPNLAREGRFAGIKPYNSEDALHIV